MHEVRGCDLVFRAEIRSVYFPFEQGDQAILCLVHRYFANPISDPLRNFHRLSQKGEHGMAEFVSG